MFGSQSRQHDLFGREPQTMRVVKISKTVAEQFVVKKHYSRRASIFWAGFGLEISGKIEGVVVYGQPSAPIQKHAFINREWKFYELSRLVVQTNIKNAASFLISQSLRMLDHPCSVISYADTEYNHCGIVYQATNWIYTGSTVSHDHAYIVDGKRIHPMTLRDKGITNPKEWAKLNNVETVAPAPKHRYFFFCGTKRQRKTMRDCLKYPAIADYPKCDQRRYDDGPRLDIDLTTV